MARDKTHALVTTLREVTIMLLAALEDYLDVAYDKSALAKRRIKTYGSKESTGYAVHS
jgi:hypothetical protein